MHIGQFGNEILVTSPTMEDHEQCRGHGNNTGSRNSKNRATGRGHHLGRSAGPVRRRSVLAIIGFTTGSTRPIVSLIFGISLRSGLCRRCKRRNRSVYFGRIRSGVRQNVPVIVTSASKLHLSRLNGRRKRIMFILSHPSGRRADISTIHADDSRLEYILRYANRTFQRCQFVD